MRLPAALRLVGWVLAVAAGGSTILAAYTIVGTLTASSGPEASMGLLVLLWAGRSNPSGRWSQGRRWRCSASQLPACWTRAVRHDGRSSAATALYSE